MGRRGGCGCGGGVGCGGVIVVLVPLVHSNVESCAVSALSQTSVNTTDTTAAELSVNVTLSSSSPSSSSASSSSPSSVSDVKSQTGERLCRLQLFSRPFLFGCRSQNSTSTIINFHAAVTLTGGRIMCHPPQPSIIHTHTHRLA